MVQADLSHLWWKENICTMFLWVDRHLFGVQKNGLVWTKTKPTILSHDDSNGSQLIALIGFDDKGVVLLTIYINNNLCVLTNYLYDNRAAHSYD